MVSSAEVLVSGVVVPARLNPGSKSDMMGAVLVTEAGQSFSLRKAGDNAFMPSNEVKSLFGQRVTLEGMAIGGSTFVYKHLHEQRAASQEELEAVQKTLEALSWAQAR